ncbi:Pre-mRNA-processing factor 39 [Armadillidium vulgare]|nr:Pre-mRNA-processing factor 39 [Armadillidium vulgare]
MRVDEEMKLIRDHIIEARQKTHEATVNEAKARWNYEDSIKRPYFHVKPLEKSQLNAWRSYLEFELKEGNHNRIKVLFERCLIACAFYEEFWMRYIRYLEEHSSDEEELRSVYTRACTIHLRDKLRPHLAWASFEEEKGKSDTALQILSNVSENMDLCLEVYMMSVAVERRRGNLDAAENIYLKCLEKFHDKENMSAYSSIAVKYARFLTFFRNDCEKAMQIIKDAYESDRSNFNLLIALADHALACRPPNFSAAAEAFKTGTDVSYSPTVKLMFAHRYLHFVTECATENTSMNEALRLLRKIQQEVRQSQSESEEDNLTKGYDACADNFSIRTLKQIKNQYFYLFMKISLIKSQDLIIYNPAYSFQKSSKSGLVSSSLQDKNQSAAVATTVASVNGAVTTQQMNQTAAAYQNYQSQGYGYNQYQQGYSSAQYPNWGYTGQQQSGGYTGYNQQGWGGYPNYYGQR